MLFFIFFNERILLVTSSYISLNLRPGDFSPIEKSIFLTALANLHLLEVEMDLIYEDSGLYSPGPGVFEGDFAFIDFCAFPIELIYIKNIQLASG